jgi:hypothetical protein
LDRQDKKRKEKMAKILNFQQRPKAIKFKEFHDMWASQEDKWIIWRCYSCSRKVKVSKDSNEFVIERKGNFYAQHNGSFDQIVSPGNV